ncbi:MAG TPA: translesion DNA synthesis-associated protein ImuA [Woeseiaceae bacterium]|nr:translesion DNA synthesis-associated protein ImuA [Woeseiaceae bacterium]
MNEALESLLKNPRVWRARNAATAEAPQGWPSGYRKLDRVLPGAGWPRHALTEILVEHPGTGELRLLMPALAQLCRAGKSDTGEAGWITWIAPPFQPYPPALTQWGIDLSRLLVVHPKQSTDTLWAAEQALASGNCAAVLLWPDFSNFSRRLQLAAEKGRSWAIAFRPLEARAEISAAALRLELVKGERGTDVRILKSRGGRPATVQNVIHEGDRANVNRP